MRRLAGAVLTLSLLSALTACSEEEPTIADPTRSPSASPTPAPSPTDPPGPEAPAPATGPRVVVTNLDGEETLRFNLPEDGAPWDYKTGEPSAASRYLEELGYDAGNVSIATQTLRVAPPFKTVEDFIPIFKDDLTYRMKVIKPRVVNGVDMAGLKGRSKYGSTYVFVGVNDGWATSISINFSAKKSVDKKVRAWLEAMFASAEWK